MIGREFDAYHNLAFGMYRPVRRVDREWLPSGRTLGDEGEGGSSGSAVAVVHLASLPLAEAETADAP